MGEVKELKPREVEFKDGDSDEEDYSGGIFDEGCPHCGKTYRFGLIWIAADQVILLCGHCKTPYPEAFARDVS